MQICRIEMVTSELDRWTMELLPGILNMKAEKELTQYLMTEWRLGYKDGNSTGNTVVMEVVFRRRIVNEMLTTYLPSVLLILITYSTTFFKEFYFEAAVSVNLTTMLVGTTLFIR